MRSCPLLKPLLAMMTESPSMFRLLFFSFFWFAWIHSSFFLWKSTILMDPTVILWKGHQYSDFHFVFMLNWQNNDNKMRKKKLFIHLFKLTVTKLLWVIKISWWTMMISSKTIIEYSNNKKNAYFVPIRSCHKLIKPINWPKIWRKSESVYIGKSTKRAT